MNNSTLYDMWENLNSRVNNECTSDTQNMYARFANCAFGSAYIAINKNKDKSIFIDLPFYPDNISFPNIKGLSFKLIDVPQIKENTIFLRLCSKSQNCLDEAFEAFSVTLIEAIKELKDPVEVIDAIFDVTERYLQFFSPEKTTRLTKTQEQGLFGELLFINKYLDDIGNDKVVEAWTGPSKNKHDFIFPNNVGVEIKTISSQLQKNISISNENQLDFQDRKLLFLKLYILEVNPNGTTIDELISSIERKITSFNAKKNFMYKLLEYGIVLNMFNGQYRFVDVNDFVYLIDESFPKLIKSSLNSLIFDVKYKVNIDSQPTFSGNLYEQL